MKYLLFSIAVAGIPPGAVLLVLSRRLRRLAVIAMIAAVICFDRGAINFFSLEAYRGTSRGMEISIIYLIAAAMLIARCVRRGAVPLCPGRGAVLYAAYFLASLPSALNAENHLILFFEAWKMLMMLIVFLALFDYLEETRDFEAVMHAFAIVTVVNLAAVIREHFAGVYQVRGVFPHQNSMAMYMMLTGNLFFARFFNRAEPLKSGAAFGLFLCAGAVIFRTYSRGAMLCFPFSVMVTAAVSALRGFRSRMLRLIPPLCAAALFGVLVFLPGIVGRFETAPASSGSMRRNFAVAALNMIADHPWCGVGLNNWGIKINPPYEYSRHRDPRRGFTEEYKDGIVETIYLLVAAECGVPCLVLLLLWFGYHLRLSLRLLGRLRGTPDFFWSAGLSGGLTGVYLQSLLEWVLKQQINFLELMIVFAVAGVLEKRCGARRILPRRGGGIVADGSAFMREWSSDMPVGRKPGRASGSVRRLLPCDFSTAGRGGAASGSTHQPR